MNMCGRSAAPTPEVIPLGALKGSRDEEFFNPFDPRSPEGLIYQFRVTHCCSMSYESYVPESDDYRVKHELFTLPFDTFLRSVRDFKPLRAHFLSDGPHVYIRQFLDAYWPDDREKAKRLSFIADAMLSKTTNAMGVIANFLEFASREAVSQAIAERLPPSRKRETPEEGHARWKGYWKSVREIEESFKAIVAIYNIPCSRDNPKILGGYDTEIVGDRIA